jgi:hypothetical protein
VPPQDFDFQLRTSDPRQFRELLDELAAAVFGFVGIPEPDAAWLVAGLAEALAVAGERACDVRFRAQSGALTVDVSCGGTSLTHLSHELT